MTYAEFTINSHIRLKGVKLLGLPFSLSLTVRRGGGWVPKVNFKALSLTLTHIMHSMQSRRTPTGKKHAQTHTVNGQTHRA